MSSAFPSDLPMPVGRPARNGCGLQRLIGARQLRPEVKLSVDRSVRYEAMVDLLSAALRTD